MTSGTYGFAVSANDLVAAALRQTGRFASYDTIPTADSANVLQALNMLVKALAKNQKPLWCVQQVTVPLTASNGVYNLSTLSGTTRPLRVTYAFIRDSSGNDTEIALVARDDYNRLGQKSAAGVPNQAYYNPQLGAATLTLYDIPADATRTLYVDIQRQIQDFNLLTDNPDFPQEAFHMLKWLLADEISLEYLTPADMRTTISQKAKEAYTNFFDEEREEVSMFLTPSERMR
jgi:hypothetical protein